MWTPVQIYNFQRELESVKAYNKTLKPLKTIKLANPCKLKDKLDQLQTR